MSVGMRSTASGAASGNQVGLPPALPGHRRRTDGIACTALPAAAV
ncbi:MULTISPECIES: hypothetical protein [unclassified Streptomyces]